MCTWTRGGGGVDRAVCLCVCVGVSWRDTYEGRALYMRPLVLVSPTTSLIREKRGWKRWRKTRERWPVFCARESF